ncbi:MAG: hypothetical protein IAA16_03175 [Candidatus Treponema excrementipullorum]|uniref:Polysaccharide chain length determinant N-terminal domain-containing protein n=1 Tax=Candidatus Treponema excrementipullorum TaxID=2838768 RepID=A0A9E2L2U0_9SPIR|nr:hypothetical protein [Candidatus Treponema excrementipullorum]
MESSSVQKNQEISFIDLLAVLIRYRVLIILGTLIFTGVAVLYTTILPKFFPSMNTRSIAVTYTLETRELPSDVQRILSNSQASITLLTMSRLQNQFFFAEQYKKLFKDKKNIPKDDYEYNIMIQQYQKNNYSVSKGEIPGTLFVTFTIPDTEEYKEKVSSFMEDSIDLINSELKSTIMPQINAMLTLLKEIELKEIDMKENTNQEGNMSTYLQDQKNMLQLEYVVKNYDSFVEADDIPYIVPLQQDSKLFTIIIVAFASFFLFVFIAFTLNAVKNIKQNPQARQTISDAWYRKD